MSNTGTEPSLFFSSVTISGPGSCSAWLTGPRTGVAHVLNIPSSLDRLPTRPSDIGHPLSLMIANNVKFHALSFTYAAPGLHNVVSCQSTPMHENVPMGVKMNDETVAFLNGEPFDGTMNSPRKLSFLV